MKKFSKLFLTLAVCLASAAMFSSCAQILNTMVYGSGISKIEFTNSTAETVDKEFSVKIYSCNQYGICSDIDPIFSGKYELGSSIKVSGKLTKDNYYYIVVEDSAIYNKASVNYSILSPNISSSNSKLYFKASDCNYKLSLITITTSSSTKYTFKLSEL